MEFKTAINELNIGQIKILLSTTPSNIINDVIFDFVKNYTNQNISLSTLAVQVCIPKLDWHKIMEYVSSEIELEIPVKKKQFLNKLKKTKVVFKNVKNNSPIIKQTNTNKRNIKITIDDTEKLQLLNIARKLKIKNLTSPLLSIRVIEKILQLTNTTIKELTTKI